MKLYGHPISAMTRKVLILLAEKGVEADFVMVDVMKKEQKGRQHLARQPFGHIPVLEDEGFVLYESNAILKYLDLRFPEPAFTPARLRDQGRMEQWLCIEQAELGPAMRKVYARDYANMMEFDDPGGAVVEEGKADTSHVLDVLDEALERTDYLAGDKVSLADICWLPGINMLFDAELRDMIDDRANLAAWWEKMDSRPSWRKVLADMSAKT